MATSQLFDHQDPQLALREEPEKNSKDDSLADFAQDELLRQLRLDEWFAIADHSTPVWCH